MIVGRTRALISSMQEPSTVNRDKDGRFPNAQRAPVNNPGSKPNGVNVIEVILVYYFTAIILMVSSCGRVRKPAREQRLDHPPLVKAAEDLPNILKSRTWTALRGKHN